MPAFATEFEPVALPNQVVRLQPDDQLRRVEAVEQFGEIGPIDLVAESDSVSAPIAADGETEPIKLDDLETSEDQVAQARIDILSRVRLQVRQPKNQDFRYALAGGNTELTPAMSENLRELYVNRDDTPQFIVQNPNKYPLDQVFVNATGFKLVLEPGTVPEQQVSGEPVSFPVKTLSQITQGSSGGGGQPQTQTQSARRRGGD